MSDGMEWAVHMGWNDGGVLLSCCWHSVWIVMGSNEMGNWLLHDETVWEREERGVCIYLRKITRRTEKGY